MIFMSITFYTKMWEKKKVLTIFFFWFFCKVTAFYLTYIVTHKIIIEAPVSYFVWLSDIWKEWEDKNVDSLKSALKKKIWCKKSELKIHWLAVICNEIQVCLCVHRLAVCNRICCVDTEESRTMKFSYSFFRWNCLGFLPSPTFHSRHVYICECKGGGGDECRISFFPLFFYQFSYKFI